ncbi:UNVERIFIED_CONTAM: Disease resistance protein RPP13 [Sesamum radiatum]|uniref:Disease resistance protein RPP13 n=1 Tax=Sesamum radiatum TaxID=300843 RepID=A0AAW2RZC6_SESRA
MAYAAVISLMKTIEGLPYSPLISSLPPFPTESAYKELNLLEQFLQRPLFTSGSSERVNALERQIREIVCRLEDVLESYVLNQFLSQSETIRRGRTSYPLTLSRVLALDVKEEIDFFVQKVQVIIGAELSNLSLTEEDDAVVSSRTAEVFLDRKKSKIVGFDNELINLKILLTRDTRDLEVVSIFGMAGIGKTALANEVYIDPLVQDYFDCSAFVPIGQKYEVRGILLGILAQMDCGIDGRHAESNEELGKYLCRCLEEMSYLIVLDDIWNAKLWFELKRYFPKNRKGSRIVLTTRLEMVAFYATNSRKYLHRMRFLSEKESWHLLRETVFGEEHSCPPQLEKAGKKIAEKCDGLPLAIIEVGKQLSKAEWTPEYWDEVALAEKKIQFSIVQTRKFQRCLENLSQTLFWPASGAPGPELKPVGSILSSGISAHSCTKEVLGRIPNLTRLGIQIGLTLDVAEPLCCFDHLRYLRRLESLKCVILNPNPGLRVVVPTPPITVFPSSLKKLTLSGVGFLGIHDTIAKLRNLEVLKLRCHAFRGPVWNAYDCQFLQLKFLLLEDIDLEYWYRGSSRGLSASSFGTATN